MQPRVAANSHEELAPSICRLYCHVGLRLRDSLDARIAKCRCLINALIGQVAPGALRSLFGCGDYSEENANMSVYGDAILPGDDIGLGWSGPPKGGGQAHSVEVTASTLYEGSGPPLAGRREGWRRFACMNGWRASSSPSG